MCFGCAELEDQLKAVKQKLYKAQSQVAKLKAREKRHAEGGADNLYRQTAARRIDCAQPLNKSTKVGVHSAGD